MMNVEWQQMKRDCNISYLFLKAATELDNMKLKRSNEQKHIDDAIVVIDNLLASTKDKKWLMPQEIVRTVAKYNNIEISKLKNHNDFTFDDIYSFMEEYREQMILAKKGDINTMKGAFDFSLALCKYIDSPTLIKKNAA